MKRDAIDLGPLLTPVARERLVRRVMAAALPELQRRAMGRGPILVLADWARPALAAAALIALASALALGLARPGSAVSPTPASGLAEALNVPSPVSTWIVTDRDPTVGDMIAVVEGGIR